ncbi:hypothetical protein KKE45_03330 [Patescibacteria group bacterium]|nr:hypothetical protein [Patescibacteria group bacterium]
MKYLDFLRHFENRQIISIQNIRNKFGDIDRHHLSVWLKKGWLVAIKKGFYALPQKNLDVHLIANRVNKSYISLEYALSFYQIIPEITRVVTSISCERAEKFENAFGTFSYYKIKSDLFSGYVNRESKIKDVFFKIASAEKALFDLVYFRNDLKDKDDLIGLRLNLEKKMDLKKIHSYIELIQSKIIKKRLLNFFDYLNA